MISIRYVYVSQTRYSVTAPYNCNVLVVEAIHTYVHNLVIICIDVLLLIPTMRYTNISPSKYNYPH